MGKYTVIVRKVSEVRVDIEAEDEKDARWQAENQVINEYPEWYANPPVVYDELLYRDVMRVEEWNCDLHGAWGGE